MNLFAFFGYSVLYPLRILIDSHVIIYFLKGVGGRGRGRKYPLLGEPRAWLQQ